jgi:CheY-like chemotaxis protein
MPVMDGIEAASLIKDIDPEIPIVAITANLIACDSTEESDFDEIATKPLKRDNLLRVIYKFTSKTTKFFRDFSA